MKGNLLALILVIGGMFLGQSVSAEMSAIAVSPLVFELTGKPGETFENYVKVYNPNPNTMTVKMTAEDMAPSGEEGFVVVEPAETESYSLASWIKTDPEEFDLNSREEKTVKFTITIPVNAEPGGHYGTVVSGIKAFAGSEITGTTIIQRIGTLVLLTIPGQMKEVLAVKEFSAPGYSEFGPIPFSIKFENKGTVHVKPSGFITVTDWFGRKVADVNYPSLNVLPSATRKFDTSLNKKWFFGKYTATITGSYGSSNTPLTSKVITFWVFPWKIGLGALLVLIFLILTRRRWMTAARILIKGR